MKADDLITLWRTEARMHEEAAESAFPHFGQLEKATIAAVKAEVLRRCADDLERGGEQRAPVCDICEHRRQHAAPGVGTVGHNCPETDYYEREDEHRADQEKSE